MFLVSGLIHQFGNYVILPSLNSPVSMQFFILQAMAIIFEDTVLFIYSKKDGFSTDGAHEGDGICVGTRLVRIYYTLLYRPYHASWICSEVQSCFTSLDSIQF